MNKKLIGLSIILFLLSSLLVLINNVYANPEYEDFTGYTEVDPNSHISLSGTNHVDHTAYRDEDVYLYEDKGVDHFTDFEHLVDVRSDFLQNDGYGVGWMVSNNVDDLKGLIGGGYSLLWLSIFYSGTKKMYIGESDGVTTYSDIVSGLSDNTWYYLVIAKDGTSFTCDIYSDSDRTVLVDALSLTLHSDYSFRYIFACNTYNDGSGSGHHVHNDIANLDLGEGVPDNPPFYSDVGNDGITQVGEDVTVSCYWEDDFELNWTIVSHNSTGSYVNFTVSCSGNASWSNKTFQLNYTSDIKVGYLFYGQDNTSQWNSTSIYYITTKPLYLTFNLNNSTRGKFYVDLEHTVNETENSYDYNETVFLLGATYNKNYTWCNFTYSETTITENFYNYTTEGNKTVWCNFDVCNITVSGDGECEYTENDLNEYFVLGAIISGVCCVISMVILIDKKDLIRGK